MKLPCQIKCSNYKHNTGQSNKSIFYEYLIQAKLIYCNPLGDIDQPICENNQSLNVDTSLSISRISYSFLTGVTFYQEENALMNFKYHVLDMYHMYVSEIPIWNSNLVQILISQP